MVTLVALVLAGVLSAPTPAPTAHAAVTDFTVRVGQATSIPLRVLGVGTAGAFDFTLKYAPTAITLGKASVPACAGASHVVTPGTMRIAIACVDPQPLGTLTVNVPVTGVAPGFSILTVYDCDIADVTPGRPERSIPCAIVGARVKVVR